MTGFFGGRYHGAGTFPTGGTASKEFAPKIVVGNSTAGDTIANCDYLDIGNGAQLSAALAASAGLRDVWARPGTYNLGLVGSPATPLVVPTNTTVRGAGRQLTIIRTDTVGDNSAFDLSSNSHIENLKVEVSVPVGPAVGVAQVVDLKAGATCTNMRIEFLAAATWVAGTLALTSIRTVFRVSSVTSSTYLLRCGSSHDIALQPPSFNALVPGTYLTLCDIAAGSDYPRIRDCYLVGGDIGIDMMTSGGSISENTIETSVMGLRVRGGTNPLTIMNNTWLLRGAGSGIERGIDFTSTRRAVSVIGNRFDAVAIVAGSVGIDTSGLDTSTIVGNTIEHFDTGVALDINSGDNVVSSNVLRDITAAQHVTNLGSGNEVVHNIEV